MIKTLLLVGLIVVVALGLRLPGFGQLPLSLNRDEAALGYNAWALVQQGMDEWGKPWPVSFKSFGDYKLPGYIYLLVPFVAVFGTDEWVIRLPSLMAGLVNIGLLWLIAKQLFPKQPRLWWLTAFFGATLPWSIHYAHIAFEAHVALSWTLATLWLMLKAAQNIRLLLLTPLTLGLALFTYNAPLLLAPLLVASYAWFFRFELRSKAGLVGLLGLVMVIVIGAWGLLNVSQAKSGISIFTDPGIATQYRESRVALAQRNPLLAKLIMNQYVYYGKEVGQRYVASWLPFFLVQQGGTHPWHSLPGWSHFSWLQYGLFILGVGWWLIKSKSPAETWILFLLGISLVPAIITVDAPHATRSLLFLTLAALPMALATEWLAVQLSQWATKYTSWSKQRLFNSILSVFVILLLLEPMLYVKDYLTKFPQQHAPSWKAGFKQSLAQAGSITIDQPIYITNHDSSPYIYVLLYNQVLPSQFLESVVYYPVDTAGLESVASFGRYHFVGGRDQVPAGSVVIDQTDAGDFMVEEL